MNVKPVGKILLLLLFIDNLWNIFSSVIQLLFKQLQLLLQLTIIPVENALKKLNLFPYVRTQNEIFGS